MFTRLYRKFRNLDKISSLESESFLNRQKYLKADTEILRLKNNIKSVMEARNKWKHIHSSTTSDEFPNSIRMVFNKILNGVVEVNFDKVTRSTVRDVNSPTGYTHF